MTYYGDSPWHAFVENELGMGNPEGLLRPKASGNAYIKERLTEAEAAKHLGLAEPSLARRRNKGTGPIFFCNDTYRRLILKGLEDPQAALTNAKAVAGRQTRKAAVRYLRSDLDAWRRLKTPQT
jgi:hypothetical protein